MTATDAKESKQVSTARQESPGQYKTSIEDVLQTSATPVSLG